MRLANSSPTLIFRLGCCRTICGRGAYNIGCVNCMFREANKFVVIFDELYLKIRENET